MEHLRQAETALAHAHVLVQEALADARGQPACMHGGCMLVGRSAQCGSGTCAAICRCSVCSTQRTGPWKVLGHLRHGHASLPMSGPFLSRGGSSSGRDALLHLRAHSACCARWSPLRRKAPVPE